MKWFPCMEPLCRRSGDGYRWSVKNVVAQLRPSAQARAVRFAGGLSLREHIDLFGDELGVILDPAEESRAARVLPGETEEVEPRYVGHASPVTDAAVRICDGKLDPGVIRLVSGRPDDGVDLELAAIGEADRATRGGDRPRLQLDAVAPQLARARPDQRVAVAQPAPEPRLDRLVKQPRLRQPPKEVAAEEPLRQRCLARPDRELDAMGRGELRRDLKAGVTAADDENRSLRDVARAPVDGAVCLEHVWRELAGEGWHARNLKGTGGDNDLVGLDLPALEPDDEPSALRVHRLRRAPQLDRELEGGGVLLKIGDHFVASRVTVRITSERKAGKAVVTAWREQSQRVPAIAPSDGNRIGSVDDQEPSARARQEVADRKARLARSDHHDLEALASVLSRARVRRGRLGGAFCGIHSLDPSPDGSLRWWVVYQLAERSASNPEPGDHAWQIRISYRRNPRNAYVTRNGRERQSWSPPRIASRASGSRARACSRSERTPTSPAVPPPTSSAAKRHCTRRCSRASSPAPRKRWRMPTRPTTATARPRRPPSRTSAPSSTSSATTRTSSASANARHSKTKAPSPSSAAAS